VAKGRVAFLATADLPELTEQVVDYLAGPMPLAVTPADKQVILTRQDQQHRWILHLMDDGDCSINISKDYAPLSKVVSLYPDKGWECTLEKTPLGVCVKASGVAKDRLIVME
jgi:hypothetical protein